MVEARGSRQLLNVVREEGGLRRVHAGNVEDEFGALLRIVYVGPRLYNVQLDCTAGQAEEAARLDAGTHNEAKFDLAVQAGVAAHGLHRYKVEVAVGEKDGAGSLRLAVDAVGPVVHEHFNLGVNVKGGGGSLPRRHLVRRDGRHVRVEAHGEPNEPLARHHAFLEVTSDVGRRVDTYLEVGVSDRQRGVGFVAVDVHPTVVYRRVGQDGKDDGRQEGGRQVRTDQVSHASPVVETNVVFRSAVE
mmetsp:Transcript_5763/g.18765  ORF Transcript_5763/g.18765 Transcript_5763/m.18765 type:complete len:245 (+) Transcript_5763:2419-3153(+)